MDSQLFLDAVSVLILEAKFPLMYVSNVLSIRIKIAKLSFTFVFVIVFLISR